MRRAAAIARELGLVVHLLQWDVARLAFDTPEILSRYPEVNGVTHAAIRVAVGRWAREAVGHWDAAHPGAEHVLLGETPIVGERLASLARPADDAVEPLLASAATLFLVPVPSSDVRRLIVEARSRDMATPRHERDRASAPAHLVRWHWDDLVAVARELCLAEEAPREYDADLYARTFAHLLRHRRATMVRIDEVVEAEETADAVDGAREIVPTPGDVAAALASIQRRPQAEVERIASEWYRL